VTAPPLWRACAVYTVSRLGLFVVFAILLYVAGLRGLVVLLAPLLLSGIASYYLLARQRTLFAAALQRRLARRTPRISERTAREDAIVDRLAGEDEEQPREVG
jgi:hypothetical protein